MKKCIVLLCVVVSLVGLLTPSLALERWEYCEQFGHAESGYMDRAVRYQSLGANNHVRVYVRDEYCTYCYGLIKEGTIEHSEVEPHTFGGLTYANVEHYNNATQHWSIRDHVENCSKCSRQNTLATDVEFNRGNHEASAASNWIDAGHSGSYHYYDKYCKEPTCTRRFRWRTIACPGGSNHIAPDAYQPPIDVVTE